MCKYDKEAILSASKNGDLGVAKILIDGYSSYGIVDCGGLAVIFAAEGNLEIVKYLVEKCISCNVDIRAWNEEALTWAARYGHLEVVKYLAEECNVDAYVFDEYALRHACSNGHLEVVKYLVEKCGSNAHIWNDAVIDFAYRNGHADVVKYLEEVIVNNK
jgi:ankyrin repeat protein